MDIFISGHGGLFTSHPYVHVPFLAPLVHCLNMGHRGLPSFHPLKHMGERLRTHKHNEGISQKTKQFPSEASTLTRDERTRVAELTSCHLPSFWGYASGQAQELLSHSAEILLVLTSKPISVPLFLKSTSIYIEFCFKNASQIGYTGLFSCTTASIIIIVKTAGFNNKKLHSQVKLLTYKNKTNPNLLL